VIVSLFKCILSAKM